MANAVQTPSLTQSSGCLGHARPGEALSSLRRVSSSRPGLPRRATGAGTAMAVHVMHPPSPPLANFFHYIGSHLTAAVQALSVSAPPSSQTSKPPPGNQTEGDDVAAVRGRKDPSELAEEERRAYDLQIAEKAVQLSCWLTQRVQAQLRKSEEQAQSKSDKSFVTVADYGVQAVVSWILAEAYPGEDISLIAEEDAKDLTGEENVDTLQRLVGIVNECLLQAPVLGIPAPARPLTAVEILASISRGSSPGGPVGRHWVLDPVDGTLGFVRQDQYAVALALIEDGGLTLGVLGCPNLPTRAGWLRHPHRYMRLAEKMFPPEEDAWTRGVVMKAQKGKGASMTPLLLGNGEDEDYMEDAAALALEYAGGVAVKVSPVQNPVDAVFCEPVEKANSNQGLTGHLASNLGMTSEALRMYSMAKYAAVARGDAEIFMKFAKSTYREKIWDHAAGVIIVEEAGGVVSDAGGLPLDFSKGRFLDGLDRGIIATNGPGLHQTLLDALDESWDSSRL